MGISKLGDQTRRQFFWNSALLTAAISTPAFLEACGGNSPGTSGVRTLTFAHGEPATGTVYAYHSNLFKQRLEALSNGTLTVSIYPNAQLGDETVTTKKTIAGDIDFSLSAVGNSAAVAPSAAILELQYIFSGQAHLLKALNDPTVNQQFNQLMADSVKTARSLGLYTEGVRNLYAKFPIHSVADIKGKKVRIQASQTENAFFAAYGAVPVQMGFGQVYTSLQTGVVDVAENNVTAYLAGKHYEVAPVYSSTEHEADIYHMWVSGKTWDSLNAQQQTWISQAATETQPQVNQYALQLWQDSLAQVVKLGVKYVAATDVDKSGFQKIASSIVDQQAQSLGAGAVKLLAQIRSLS